MKLQLNLPIVFWCHHLLSQIDRDHYSSTAGCFDRKYWAWKARDFPDATLQYAAVPLLKSLRLTSLESEPQEKQYYINIAIMASQFLLRIQHSNGSFDQCYPYECHPGVVFDVLPLWIYLLDDFRDYLDSPVIRELEKGLEQAIQFVSQARENYAIISNHLAHFSYVLFLIDKIWNRPECRDLAKIYLNTLLKHQSSEGWYLEYEGPDMGYQTRTLSYLARILQIRQDPAIEESAKRAITFLSCFAYPDGSFGGEIGTRNTSLFYPFGLAWFAHKDPTASALLRFAIDSWRQGRGVLLHQTDLDNLIRLFDDQIETQQLLESCDLLSPELLPFEQVEFENDYKEAGIIIRRRYWYYAVANLTKGGICKVYNVAERRPVYVDIGWLYKSGQMVYSNHMHQAAAMIQMDRDLSMVLCRFFRTTHDTLTPFRMVILRLLNLTILRFQWAGDLARRLITRRLFTRKLSGDVQFERHFHWGKNIRVETTVSWQEGKQRFFYITSSYTAIPMASAKYFQLSDLFFTGKEERQKFFSGQTHTIVIKPQQSAIEGGEMEMRNSDGLYEDGR